MNKDFNRIKSASENVVKNFAVLSNGNTVEYYEKKTGKMIGLGISVAFLEGRLVTTARPNGIAFESMEVEKASIIGYGTLLNPKEDIRDFEEQSLISDRNE